MVRLTQPPSIPRPQRKLSLRRVRQRVKLAHTHFGRAYQDNICRRKRGSEAPPGVVQTAPTTELGSLEAVLQRVLSSRPTTDRRGGIVARALDCKDAAHDDIHFTAQDDDELFGKIQQHR